MYLGPPDDETGNWTGFADDLSSWPQIFDLSEFILTCLCLRHAQIQALHEPIVIDGIDLEGLHSIFFNFALQWQKASHPPSLVAQDNAKYSWSSLCRSSHKAVPSDADKGLTRNIG